MTSAFALNSWTKRILILLFLVFGLLIVLIFSPPSVYGSTQYRLWILAYNVDQQAGFVSACTFASTVDGACEYFDMSKLFVEKGGKKDFIAGFVTRELNSAPPADMQMCVEAQLTNGSNASPGDWFQCKPIIKDDKGFYTSQIDFTGLKYSTLQPYQPTNNMTAYETTGNLSQPYFGTELTGNVTSSTMGGNMSIDNPVLTSGSTFYVVHFFISNPFLLGKPVFITTEIDKENATDPSSSLLHLEDDTVNTENLIGNNRSNPLLINTLTIEDKDGQHPSQVWACPFATDAPTSPFCEPLIPRNANEYYVTFNYTSLVQDLLNDKING